MAKKRQALSNALRALGQSYKRALCPVLIPRIWCLTLLGQMQSWLCLLNVAFASTATRQCFRSCSFMVLGNTSQSARRTLWTPITSQLSPSTAMERSQTNLPQSSTSGHSGPNWPPEGTPGPICQKWPPGGTAGQISQIQLAVGDPWPIYPILAPGGAPGPICPNWPPQGTPRLICPV